MIMLFVKNIWFKTHIFICIILCFSDARALPPPPPSLSQKKKKKATVEIKT